MLCDTGLKSAVIGPLALILVLAAPWGTGTGLAAQGDKKDVQRPAIALKANPLVSFAPARVSLTAELRGGDDDYEEFYCAAIEWDWGDGTSSESRQDCEPYEAGKSVLKRRFAIQHAYNTPGAYRVAFRLKRNDKVLGSAAVNVQVRPGARDPGF